MAFAASIVWLDIIANEAVALMENLGVLMDISTGVLGLTVLAVGNSVGDLVADTSFARAGLAKMAVASCFGSPLLNDMLGLGKAPQPYVIYLSAQCTNTTVVHRTPLKQVLTYCTQQK